MTTSVAPAARVGEAEPRRYAARHVYLDNLKVVLVASIIVGHAFITYGDIGEWKYNEPSGNDAFNVLAGLAVSLGALFAMGLFFLIAGLLTPGSLARKGWRRFAADRALRLGVPLLAYLLFIYPLLGWLGEGMDRPLLSTIRAEIPRWDPGPLWFVAALLLFSVVYAAYRTIRPADRRRIALGPHHLVLLGALVAITTFFVRVRFPIDSRQFLMIHVWQWPQCIGLFVLGAAAAERGWLDPVPDRLRRRAGWWALGGIALVIGAFIANGGGSFDPFAGGWTWQAVAVAVAEGVISVSLAVWLLGRFRARHDAAGPMTRTAGRAAFGAYLLQAPVLVGLAVALRDTGLAPEAKFAIVAPIGLAASFAVAWLLALIPGVRRVL